MAHGVEESEGGRRRGVAAGCWSRTLEQSAMSLRPWSRGPT